MKKNYLFGLCAATMLLTTSCQKDGSFADLFQGKQEPVTVKMSVSLPEMQSATRAGETKHFGDGTTAKILYYGVFEVYDTNNDGEDERVYLPNISGIATFNQELEADITLKLMPKSTYDIAFWAAADGAPYTCTFSGSSATVDVDYSKVLSNNENNDAFFGTTTVANVALDGGNTLLHNDGEPIKLYRPFAQLNIATATADYEAASKAGFEVTYTEVVVGGIYEVLDLWTGEVSSADAGGDNSRVYQKAAIPTAEYTFPIVEGQKYLSMNYLLMDKDGTTFKVTFKHYTTDDREKTREFSNVPLRRNWRTNIYGDLLTSDVNVKVAIAPLFADENDIDDDELYNPDENEWYDREQDKQ